MDCLEFRRLLGSEPRITDAAARAHLEQCPRCQEAYSRAQAFDARIAQAMTVALPEGFADRMLLAQLTGERQRRSRRLPLRMDCARRRGGAGRLRSASCGAKAAFGTSLPDLVVEHVNGEERPALQSARARSCRRESMRAFADRGVHLASVPAGISYVQKCPVGAIAPCTW